MPREDYGRRTLSRLDRIDRAVAPKHVTHAVWQPAGNTAGHTTPVFPGSQETNDVRRLVAILAALTFAITASSEVAFAGLGSRLVAAGGVGRIAAQPEPAEPVRLDQSSRALIVRWHPDGRSIAIGLADGTLRFVDGQDGGARGTWRAHDGAIRSIAFSPDGARVASGGDDRVLRLASPDTGRVLRRGIPKLDGTVRTVTFDTRSRRLAAGAGNRVRIFDPENGDEVRSVTCPFDVTAIAFSPDGKLIAIAREDRRIQIVEASSGNTIATLMGHRETVTTLAFDPKRPRLASGSEDRSVRIWDVSERGFGRELRSIDAHGGPVRTIAFDAPGRWIATGSDDGTVRVFDAVTGFTLRTYDDFPDRIVSLDFHPTEDELVVASAESVVLLPVDPRQFREASFDLDFTIEELRVISAPDGSPVRFHLRIANRSRSASGPIAISTEVLETGVESPRPLPDVAEISDLAPGDTSRILFFELTAPARGAFLRNKEVAIRVHADSRAVADKRVSRSTRVGTTVLDLEIAEFAIRNADGGLGTEARLELRNLAAAPPGPVALRVKLDAPGRSLIEETRIVRFDTEPEASTTFELPERFETLTRRATRLILEVGAQRVEWESHEWNERRLISTRRPSLTVESFAVETVPETGIATSLVWTLRDASKVDVGPVRAIAEFVDAEANESVRVASLATDAFTLPRTANEPIIVRLPLREDAQQVMATTDLVTLRLRIERVEWPSRSWNTVVEFATLALDLAVDSIELRGGEEAPLGVRLALANRSRQDPGPVEVSFEIDGALAYEQTLAELPPTTPEQAPVAIDFQPLPETWPHPAADTTRLTVRARRPARPNDEWREELEIATGNPEVRWVGPVFLRDPSGVPRAFSLRLQNIGPVSPGPLEVTARVRRPGRRIPDEEAATTHVIASLAPGTESRALEFALPWAAIMGGVGATGVHADLTVERIVWRGRTARSTRTLLHRPSVDVVNFEIMPDAGGAPSSVRFEIVNELDLAIDDASARVEYHAGLQGATIGSSRVAETFELPPKGRAGPFELPIPDSAAAVFDTHNFLKTRITVVNTAWEELASAEMRLVPTRPARVAVEGLTVTPAAVDRPPSIRFQIRNADTIETQFMRISLEFVERASREPIGEPTDPSPIAALAPGAASPILDFRLPAATIEALRAEREVDLRLRLLGAMRPIVASRSINARASAMTVTRAPVAPPGGFPWLWVIAAVVVGVGGTIAFLRIRAIRAAAQAGDVEFFALVDMEEDFRKPEGEVGDEDEREDDDPGEARRDA